MSSGAASQRHGSRLHDLPKPQYGQCDFCDRMNQLESVEAGRFSLHFPRHGLFIVPELERANRLPCPLRFVVQSAVQDPGDGSSKGDDSYGADPVDPEVASVLRTDIIYQRMFHGPLMHT